MNKKIVIIGSEGKVGNFFKKYLSKKNKIYSIDNLNKKQKNYFKCDITKEIEVQNLINLALDTYIGQIIISIIWINRKKVIKK